MFDAQVICERQVLPMNCNKKELLLYAVTDRSWLNGRTLYDQVEEALKGGATFIQPVSYTHLLRLKYVKRLSYIFVHFTSLCYIYTI